MTSLKTIDQSGIKALIRERLENPEKYVNTPLIIWQSDIRDGIQERILKEAFEEYNAMSDTQLWYKIASVRHNPRVNLEEMLSREQVDRNNNEPFEFSSLISRGGMRCIYRRGLIVIDPMCEANDCKMNTSAKSDYLTVINERQWGGIRLTEGVPAVVFVCNPGSENPEAYPEAEQYIFEPDFEEWARWAKEKEDFPDEIADFIRGNGDKEAIAYRWYNKFKASHPGDGCLYPVYWINPRRGLVPWEDVFKTAKRDSSARTSGANRDALERKFGTIIPSDILDSLSEYLIQLY